MRPPVRRLMPHTLAEGLLGWHHGLVLAWHLRTIIVTTPSVRVVYDRCCRISVALFKPLPCDSVLVRDRLQAVRQHNTHQEAAFVPRTSSPALGIKCVVFFEDQHQRVALMNISPR